MVSLKFFLFTFLVASVSFYSNLLLIAQRAGRHTLGSIQLALPLSRFFSSLSLSLVLFVCHVCEAQMLSAQIELRVVQCCFCIPMHAQNDIHIKVHVHTHTYNACTYMYDHVCVKIYIKINTCVSQIEICTCVRNFSGKTNFWRQGQLTDYVAASTVVSIDFE